MDKSVTPKLYDSIGSGYDGTRKADAWLVKRALHHITPKLGQRLLDLACGTGNYTIAMHTRRAVRVVNQDQAPSTDNACTWVGCDQSLRMLHSAREKSGHVSWCASDATMLPFSSATFDGALCSNALHHFANLNSVFAELRRVLKVGARVVVFSTTAEQMRGYWLNAYFPEALARSINVMPSEQVLLEAIARNRFSLREREPYFIRPDLQDSFLYSGKHDPSRYLNAEIRAGISTFAALAEQDEISSGCARLSLDIASGEFTSVAERYANDMGDYSFWILEAIA